MKTISGKVISSKPVSLSKAAKILTKFISAENGASQAISAYLHQTSAAFNELNQLHKELKSSRSGQKHKRHRSETNYGSETVEENPIRTIDISEELYHVAVQSKNKSKGQQFGSEHVADGVEKQVDNVVVGHEPNDAVGYHAGQEGSGEKHKKKKKKQEIESRKHRDNRFEIEEEENERTLPIKTQNIDEGKPTRSVKFSQESNDAVHVGGIGKHKEKKRKQEVDSRELGDNGVQIGERRDESKLTTKAPAIFAQSGAGDNLKMEGGKKHKRDKKKDNGDKVENGGLIDPQELQSKKKKTHKGGHEGKINTEEVKGEQRKKRKNEYVEERVEDRSGGPTKKKLKSWMNCSQNVGWQWTQTLPYVFRPHSHGFQFVVYDKLESLFAMTVKGEFFGCGCVGIAELLKHSGSHCEL